MLSYMRRATPQADFANITRQTHAHVRLGAAAPQLLAGSPAPPFSFARGAAPLERARGVEPAALAGSALGCGVGGAQSPVREWEGPREARGEGQSQGAGRGGVGEKTEGLNPSLVTNFACG